GNRTRGALSLRCWARFSCQGESHPAPHAFFPKTGMFADAGFPRPLFHVPAGRLELFTLALRRRCHPAQGTDLDCLAEIPLRLRATRRRTLTQATLPDSCFKPTDHIVGSEEPPRQQESFPD